MKILRLGLRKDLYRITISTSESKSILIELFVNVKFKIINNKNNKEIIFLDFEQKDKDFSLGKIPVNVSAYNFKELSEDKEKISFLREVVIKDLAFISIDNKNKVKVNFNEEMLKKLPYKITYDIKYYKVIEKENNLETIKITENEFSDILEKYKSDFNEEAKKTGINTFFFTY